MTAHLLSTRTASKITSSLTNFINIYKREIRKNIHSWLSFGGKETMCVAPYHPSYSIAWRMKTFVFLFNRKFNSDQKLSKLMAREDYGTHLGIIFEEFSPMICSSLSWTVSPQQQVTHTSTTKVLNMNFTKYDPQTHSFSSIQFVFC